ncbi:ferredoxin [Rhodococcus sp. ACS1]|uniref:FAD-dependent oxidoreductase n=1 Tax=Rhodococcus sp. ACS1 TaxID=2028570 RepID=UPI000BB15EBC|nr:FAD-dependent oxidoreductase [Rhodococcus sp. ACS1]PBC35337.1 ferredoxin [Rhodococcus sp. ACS1]
MTYLITQACCNDASCVSVCPVNCIHPTPDEPAFMSAEMLYIDPDTCIECAACVDECPVDAIKLDTDLAESDSRYLTINASYFEQNPIDPDDFPMEPKSRRGDFSGLRVAIVGSGPAASYAAAEVLRHRGAEVDMYERLLTPYGLIRSGVAPDHQGTKAITALYRDTMSKPSFHLHLGIEIGRDLSHLELLEHHSAVIYAVGASGDQRLRIDGEDLPGSHAATEFVAWYNGHPDYADAEFDLSGERAVIVGNGNVALDVARILVSDPDALDRTDIADHALSTLRNSNICEVVILGRRGPAQAAYTNSEFHALTQLPGIDVVVDPREVTLDEHTRALIDGGDASAAVRLKAELAAELGQRAVADDRKRIVFRYLVSPTEIVGDARATGVHVVRNSLVLDDAGVARAVAGEDGEFIEAGLVLRSIGYRGTGIADVPFDPKRGVIPNANGRVIDPGSGDVVGGVYTTGWIKRGPSGGIGTNKKCARDTVDLLLDDFGNGRLGPVTARGDLETLIAERQPKAVDFAGWNRIDTAERQAGGERGRPRVKFVSLESMAEAARAIDSASAR